MNPALIRSLSGIRGVVGKTMTAQESYKTTLAFYEEYLCRQISNRNKSLRVAIGMDPKLSGQDLVSGAVFALKEISKKEKRKINILYLGVTSSPVVQWTVRNYRLQGGMIFTASHNPIQYNGIKLISGWKDCGTLLKPEEMSRINTRLNISDKQTKVCNYKQTKVCNYISVVNRYNRDVVKKVKKLIDLCSETKGRGAEIFRLIRRNNPLVVIDACCLQGAYLPVSFLLTLGIKKKNIIVINTGTIENSVRRLEPAPQFLSNLRKTIVKFKADIGFALDPDQDRLVAMPLASEEYTFLLTGKFLFELQKNTKRKYIKKVVVNLSTTAAWEDIAKKYSINIIRTPVGEINVAKRMIKECLHFGGEGSGGVILDSVNYGRNSTVGMALILAYLAWSGKTIGDLERELPRYVFLKKKVKVNSGNPAEIVKNIEKSYCKRKDVSFVDKQDGCKIVFRDDSWLHIRASNTEPIIRIFAESKVNGKKTLKT